MQFAKFTKIKTIANKLYKKIIKIYKKSYLQQQ